MHFAAQAEWCFIDVVGQVLVYLIVIHGFVDEEFVFHIAFDVYHFLLQPFNLLVLHLAPSQQLQGNSLRFLQSFFHL